jgi:hypothetical protein
MVRNRMKRTNRRPHRYDWVSGERYRWLGWVNDKGRVIGYNLNVTRNAALYGISPQKYLQNMLDENELTGQAREDIIWIVETNQDYNKLIDGEQNG